jgi:hypothetical protein
LNLQEAAEGAERLITADAAIKACNPDRLATDRTDGGLFTTKNTKCRKERVNRESTRMIAKGMLTENTEAHGKFLG